MPTRLPVEVQALPQERPMSMSPRSLAMTLCAGLCVIGGAGAVAAFQADALPQDASRMDGTAAAPSARIGHHDAQFIALASRAGLQEVSDARLALMMTRRKEVQQVAQMMHQDHSDANAQLAHLIKAKGWPPPQPADSAPGPGADGSYSDVDYVRNEIDAHKSAITLFEQELGGGEDSDLRSFASTFLPNLKHHLVALQSIDAV
jgi:putative membrane protein